MNQLEEVLLDPHDAEPKTKKSNIIKVSIIVAFVSLIAGLGITFIILGNRGLPDRNGLKDQYFDLLSKTPTIQSLNKSLHHFSSRPHIAGSHQNYVFAKEIENIFKELKFDASIESFPTLLNYPLRRNVSVFNNDFTYHAELVEDIVDDGNEFVNESIPTFNGFSPSGIAEGQIIYVNYGQIDDYKYLDDLGIDFNGSIVIARYGKIFRGDKCYLAQARGAVGCLIYSDPIDDGFVKGPVYPEGPYRPESSVQRGSIWKGAGDPATPGYPSTSKSPRMTYDQLSDPQNPSLIWPLPTIPIQPMSYGDAIHFLDGLGGHKAPQHFQGGLELDDGYHIGPGPLRAKIDLEMNYTEVHLHNVLGKIRGVVEPDRYVIVGCHRDAWTYGAGDPVSGTTVLLEVAKSFGALLEKGWRPRRTIIFASWDGEEYALIGSVEYGERHFVSLTSKAVAYFNLDIAVEGVDILELKGTPSLKHMYMDIAKLVQDPKNNTRTLYDIWMQSGTTNMSEPIFDSLGSGSDFMGFINHIGVTSSSISYLDKDYKYGAVYHSNFDSYYWMTHFSDPTFEYHRAVTQLLNFALKTTSDSYILPFNYLNYAVFLQHSCEKLDKLLKTKHSKELNFTAMNESIEILNRQAIRINKEAETIIAKKSPEELGLRMINDRLMMAERAFLDYNYIPEKKWYRHMLFSPSDMNSYEGIVFPSVMNELFKKEIDWNRVQEQITYASLYIDIAAEILKGD